MKKRTKFRLKLGAGIFALFLLTGLMLWDVMQHEQAGNVGGNIEEELVMGTEPGFKPFEYKEGNEIVGFDIDLAREIAKDMGKQLRIEEMSFDGLLSALQAKRIDIVAAGMTITPEREKNVAFSLPYYSAAQKIVIREGDVGKINSIAELEHKSIGVQLGTTGDTLARKIKGARVIQFPGVSNIMQELSAGRIDAVIIDDEPAKRYIKQFPNLRIIVRNITSENYAIAMRREDLQLQRQVNDSIKKMKQDGRYDNLIKKHFNNAKNKPDEDQKDNE